MKILANPENWFPPVDQVDRPYFIAIDNENRVYSEFTDFDVTQPVTARGSVIGYDEDKGKEIRQANWYEKVDKDNLAYFVVKGRFGYYWLDMKSGAIFITAQHQEGDHPVRQFILSLEVQNMLLTDSFNPEDDPMNLPYKLKHFKISDVQLQTLGREPVVMSGMNTRKPTMVDGKMSYVKPKDSSQTEQVVFGWELKNHAFGHITFEGMVYNRIPRFDLRLLYSLPDYITKEKKVKFRFLLWDAPAKKERYVVREPLIKKGEVYEWQEKIL